MGFNDPAPQDPTQIDPPTPGNAEIPTPEIEVPVTLDSLDKKLSACLDASKELVKAVGELNKKLDKAAVKKKAGIF